MGSQSCPVTPDHCERSRAQKSRVRRLRQVLPKCIRPLRPEGRAHLPKHQRLDSNPPIGPPPPGPPSATTRPRSGCLRAAPLRARLPGRRGRRAPPRPGPRREPAETSLLPGRRSPSPAEDAASPRAACAAPGARTPPPCSLAGSRNFPSAPDWFPRPPKRRADTARATNGRATNGTAHPRGEQRES